MPEERRKRSLPPFSTQKVDIQECCKVLFYTMKFWDRCIDSRLRDEIGIQENRGDFMPGRSMTERVFVVRQLHEKYHVIQRDLRGPFIDLEQIYDRVLRELTW